MAGARSSADRRLVERVVGVCARAQEPLRLFERVAAVVRLRIPYAVAGWLLVDPDTQLLSGVYNQGVTREQHLQAITLELTEDDVNKFYELARRPVPAAALSATTDGDLRRSIRWARLYEPLGLGDELRAAFRSGDTVWGYVCLSRRRDDPSFSVTEVDLVARLCPHIGNGLRTCLLLGEVDHEGDHSPALVVLDDDGAVQSATPQAEHWLGDLEDEALATTIVVHEVAGRARALADGSVTGPPAVARTRALTGEWVTVRGARLDDAGGRTAVVLEPAHRAEIAPLLVRLHGLTSREREVTQLLLRGLPTREIAATLWITPETLRGHVKAIMGKLGVSSRPEIAAMLSGEPVVLTSVDDPAASTRAGR